MLLKKQLDYKGNKRIGVGSYRLLEIAQGK